MSSDADLSTDDLARPTGAPERNPSGAADRMPDQSSGMTPGGLGEGTPTAGAADTAVMSGQGATREDARTAEERGGVGDGADMALLDPADGERFQQRWSDVQARFVDDPQEAVRTADGLVAELMQSLAQGFSEHKGRLESAWQSGGTPDTEELRQALQRYRSFFNRLLST
jgi:hypothetical protein